MNRLQKREAILPTYENDQITVLDCCLALHISITGAADPLDSESEAKIVEFLKCCLETWEPSVLAASEPFDNAVKELIVATLAEHAVRAEKVDGQPYICILGETDLDRNHAELIARAVNCHQELLEACKEALARIESDIEGINHVTSEGDKLRAAIAHAEINHTRIAP